ncbi:hypothetical protein HII13_000830 [Brettanomyces bruxellensis]|uniref:DEBR0S2_09230g1_1 n=1 Tax=Dekkera bruxellensis TaxID=5007 RepID=A0A3F2Y3Y7_DEKBR|nr:uncharacterized protein BRETT_001602 [Brettanomyces bruxellensis]KAF6014485.1 hypothetical protein HII13_000830 [Brettanomyces bruxellensis]QOU18539.1 hypothetical protein BRETT_001602 [Brettanomyces bruxellensis]VUG17511.1 smd1 [Brettanomyces bruxellensis]
MKLCSFLMNMINERVQVELKDGTVIIGDIISVAPSMNMNLKNVRMTLKDRNPKELEFVNIRGNQVRLVILPDELDVDRVLAKSISQPKVNPSTERPSAVKERNTTKSRRGQHSF